MYHFAVAALLALATLKVVDLLDGLIPTLSRWRGLLTFALAIAAAVALDFSMFAGYDIPVRETWMGTWGTGLIIGSLVAAWQALFVFLGARGREVPAEHRDTRARVAA
jgi:hypothetical protein